MFFNEHNIVYVTPIIRIVKNVYKIILLLYKFDVPIYIYIYLNTNNLLFCNLFLKGSIQYIVIRKGF